MFGVVTVVYVVAVILTVSSVREVPLDQLEAAPSATRKHVGKYRKFSNEDSVEDDDVQGGVARGAGDRTGAWTFVRYYLYG